MYFNNIHDEPILKKYLVYLAFKSTSILMNTFMNILSSNVTYIDVHTEYLYTVVLLHIIVIQLNQVYQYTTPIEYEL